MDAGACEGARGKHELEDTVAKNAAGPLSDLKRDLDVQLASVLPTMLEPGEQMSVSTWGTLANNAVAATLWGRGAGHPGLMRAPTRGRASSEDRRPDST